MVCIQKLVEEEGFYRGHSLPIKKCKLPNRENVLGHPSFAVLYPEVYSCYAEVFVWFSPTWRKKKKGNTGEKMLHVLIDTHGSLLPMWMDWSEPLVLGRDFRNLLLQNQVLYMND